jgi:16S rRNA (cytosine967-C5)-methyltransferase
MGASPSRRIAFDILKLVEAQGAYASDLLHALLDVKVKPADAALVTELTLGVLRWQGLLDFFIERLTKQTIAALDVEVVLALRLGIYQLRFLTRIPARAAVNESVELVKRARKRSAASLVNAVLRRAAREAQAPADGFLAPDLPLAERLAITHSHPGWMVERWLARFGAEKTRALLEANNHRPALACAVHDAARRDGVVRSLEAEGFQCAPGRWLRTALRITGGAHRPLAQSEAYRQGWISIQDEASQMVPLLLGVQPGHSALDLCAAPGGKTVHLARAAGPAARVVAADVSTHRLRSVREQLARTGVTKDAETNLVNGNVEVLALDATAPLPFSAAFDRILVDAPCSGTGTLARNPEIRWRLRAEDLRELHQRQVALLGRALDALAPHGRLVYATCSLEPEENEEVIAEALALRSGFAVVSSAPELAPHLHSAHLAEGLIDAQGIFRTFPPEHECDGFFAAALERRVAAR